MYTETVDQAIIQAELTPEQAMDLIRHLAANGTTTSSIRIELRRYSNETNVYVSVANGFGTMLKAQGVGVVVPDEVTA